jgi:uncharacterized protein YdaU (DUF1376 family)
MSPFNLSLHIGDYLRRTSHLSVAQQGAFFLLILHYWANQGLPTGEQQLACIARMSFGEWRKHGPILAALFEPGWRLSWLDAELQAKIEYRNNQSKNGVTGNNRRWAHLRNKSDRDAITSRSECGRTAIASGSLPSALPQVEESQQEGTVASKTDEVSRAVVPFPRGRA